MANSNNPTVDLAAFEESKRLYRVSFMIGAAMCGSIVVCSAIAFWIFRMGGSPLGHPAITGMLRIILLVLCIVQLIVVPMINQIFAGPKRTKGPIYQNKDLWPRYLKSLFNASIATYAICEAPVLFGLFVYFVTKQIGDFILFAVISALAFFLYFPRYAQWEYELRRMG